MSTPSRSTKNQDPALIYAPPRVRDQTQQMPIEPSLPRAGWPLEINASAASRLSATITPYEERYLH